MTPGTNSKRNPWLPVLLAILTLAIVIFVFFRRSDDAPPVPLAPRPALPTSANTNSSTKVSPVKNLAETGDSVAVDDHAPETSADSKMPPPPRIPPELQAQYEKSPAELPADLKAQLEGPPPEVPEDIKRSLMIPPRVVSIEEVNNPNFRRNEETKLDIGDDLEPTPTPVPDGQLVDIVPSPIPR